MAERISVETNQLEQLPYVTSISENFQFVEYQYECSFVDEQFSFRCTGSRLGHLVEILADFNELFVIECTQYYAVSACL